MGEGARAAKMADVCDFPRLARLVLGGRRQGRAREGTRDASNGNHRSEPALDRVGDLAADGRAGAHPGGARRLYAGCGGTAVIGGAACPAANSYCPISDRKSRSAACAALPALARWLLNRLEG